MGVTMNNKMKKYSYLALGLMTFLGACGDDEPQQPPQVVVGPNPNVPPPPGSWNSGNNYGYIPNGNYNNNYNWYNSIWDAFQQAYGNIVITQQVNVPTAYGTFVVAPGTYTWGQLHSHLQQLVQMCQCGLAGAPSGVGVWGSVNYGQFSGFVNIGGGPGWASVPVNLVKNNSATLQTTFGVILDTLVTYSFQYYYNVYYPTYYPAWYQQYYAGYSNYFWYPNFNSGWYPYGSGNYVGGNFFYNNGNGWHINLGVNWNF